MKSIRKKTGYLIILLLIVGVLLFVGYVLCNKTFCEYIDNQTVAVGFGIFGVSAGYLIWRKQHEVALKGEYFSKYLNFVFRYFSIKQKQIELKERKSKLLDVAENNWTQQNNEALKEFNDHIEKLDWQEIQNSGDKEAVEFLLVKLGDNRWEKIEEIRNEFGKKFKKFSKVSNTDLAKLIENVAKIEEDLDSAKERIRQMSHEED